MSGQARRLRTMTEILGWRAEAQLNYLQKLGVAGLVDELALQFDDSFHALAELRRQGLVNEKAEHALKEIDALLDDMSDGSEDLWLPEALTSASEWEQVRILANRTLALL